ncbi:MAG: hypothetical protein WC681_13175 [Sterolibacterium sp.]|jgi:hypothetical protein
MPDLFNCFEGTAIASLRLAKRLEKKTGRQVIPFYSIPWHALICRSVNEVERGADYVDFYEHFGKSRANALLREYGARQSHSLRDPYEIRNLEQSEVRLLTLHFNTEQQFVGDVIGREYYGKTRREDYLRLVDLLAHYFDSVVRQWNPQVIYDLDTSSIYRFILLLIAKRYGVQYLSLTHSRFEDYVLVTKTLGNSIGTELHSKSQTLDSKQLEAGIRKCQEFRARTNLLNKEEARDESIRMRYSVSDFVREVASNAKFWAFTVVSARTHSLNGLDLAPGFAALLAPSVAAGFLFNVQIAFRRLTRTFGSFKLVGPEMPRRYFYMPLAYTAEGVTPEFSGGWLGDLIVLGVLRPWIPLDVSLVVKEHRAMVPERTPSQAVAIDSIPGVRYIGLRANEDVDTDPLKLIANSLGVVCVTGTSGLEASILGKPVLIFGNPVYNQYINHGRSATISDIERFFEMPEEYMPCQAMVAKYVSVVTAWGAQVEYSTLFTSKFSDRDLDMVVGLFVNELAIG